MVANARECISHLQNGRYKDAGIAFARFTLSALTISAICYGAIELTVAALALQIILGIIESIEHFKKREFIEGLLTALTVGIQVNQIIPQTKLICWKYSQHPVLTATLKQDSRGFVYLDIPDEYVKELHALFKESGSELPPYFGPGKSGAHVSVISANDMQQAQGVKIDAIGQTFQFRIANVDSVKPAFFQGVDKVWFLTLSCPELLSLREKYGFSPRLSGDHDFHITFAVRNV